MFDEILAKRGAFELEGHAHFDWCDPRLAFDPDVAGTSERMWSGALAERKMLSIWNHEVSIANLIGPTRIIERILRVRPDGSAAIEARFHAQLASTFELQLFPFDRQTLQIQVETYGWDEQQVRFRPDRASIGFFEGFEIPEWHVLDVRSRVDSVKRVRDETPISRFVLEIDVQRRSGFYLWKVMLPMVLIVMLSWSVFWMQGERMAVRVPLSATCVLTIVAFQFVVSESLPRVAYLTLLDAITIFSFALITLTALQSMVVTRGLAEHDMRLHRLDRLCRAVFPCGYLAGVAAIVTAYGI